jgi:ATP-dependent RNA helicase SUPV3L1/SUV3
MSSRPNASLRAILGPTNTGKTHYAIERMCAHSSGMMGFPLRLLAREVYDRVVAIKGPKEVGLITGEEKILPEGARWLLCTTESMPMDRDVAFVALDEAQLGADPERGHVFTDRLLHARGRDETLILGSESLKPLLRTLLPGIEIEKRPRFSNLSYAGAKKISRLPPRSAIIAFSADDVYAIAELIRRTRGGAAVVMGSLSPRTRNAQVAMYQAGEVDYLVATDAIGMGLNMDIGHVAFAGLSKFDGRRQRRLFVHEMAQIAGRAGRHQRDGTFGVTGGQDSGHIFTDVEIERIENHRFSNLDALWWRNTDLDFGTPASLIASLEWLPDRPELRAAQEADDLAVLKALSVDPDVAALARGEVATRRLWDVCGLPDFRHTGAEFHARLVARLAPHLLSGTGRIPSTLIAGEVARLDSVEGDIPKLSGRIAAIRTWTYAANRADWLDDPRHWAARTRDVEDRLSDALHAKLAERFVDRRTAQLMRGLRDNPGAVHVTVAQDGDVAVLGESMGRLEGFRFHVTAEARAPDRKKMLAAAEAHMKSALATRAQTLATAPDKEFRLALETGQGPALLWRDGVVGTLVRGKSLIAPGLALDVAVARLDAAPRELIRKRLMAWLAAHLEERLPALMALHQKAFAPETPPQLRAFLAPLVHGGGCLPRAALAETLALLQPHDRKALRRLGLVLGSLSIFHAGLLKPGPTRLRLALLAVQDGQVMPPVPMPGLGLLDKPSPELARAAMQAGFDRFGDQMLRHDLVERLALALHEQRQGHAPFAPDRGLATRLGVGDATLGRILRALGFVPAGPDQAQWRWRGLKDRGNRQNHRRPRTGAGRSAPHSQPGPRLRGGDVS